MKKILSITVCLFFIMVANAQLRWGQGTNITKAVESCRKANGTALLHTEGATKLYVTFKNSKVSEYYAIDGNGKRIPATYSSSKEAATKCYVCISIENGTNVCYEVDCANIPSGKTKAFQNSRQ